MTAIDSPTSRLDARQRLDAVAQTMREMSLHVDPQEMVKAYRKRAGSLIAVDSMVALSRRDLPSPQYRITRASVWKEEINPWKEQGRLPIFDRGILGELLYGDEPRVIHDLELADDDPAKPYFNGARSLAALPLFDDGVSTNMVVYGRRERNGFSLDELPEMLWLSNLFGRATNGLVLASKLRDAYQALDREMQSVAAIQRSLLPPHAPRVDGLDVASSYHTSQRAGGDYYDFFPLADGRVGILIADVSGHGTPAAVVMAITHTIAHDYAGPPAPPGELLGHLNRQLARRYTLGGGHFVTAFYGLYDPKRRTLQYARAGHNPPRLKRDSIVRGLDEVNGLPLGVDEAEHYDSRTQELKVGDAIVFYTDGITEARDESSGFFGVDRLDSAIQAAPPQADGILGTILASLCQFAGGVPAGDDQTLLVAVQR